MAASGTGSLVFIDDVTQDRSSRMNSEVLRAILCAQIQPNEAKLTGRRFILQMDNDPKHKSKATQEFIKAKKQNILEWPRNIGGLSIALQNALQNAVDKPLMPVGSVYRAKLREDGGWWRSWLHQSYSSVREKSAEALEFMKRDLSEFSRVVQHDTACTIAATATVVKEKLAVEGSSGTTEKVKKSLSDFLGVISDTFAPSPDKTIDCDVITLMATPSGTTELYDSTKNERRFHDNARPHVAGVCQQFLQDEGIEAMDWPARYPDLNPIEHIWDIMSRTIHQRNVAPQTVQELPDYTVCSQIQLHTAMNLMSRDKPKSHCPSPLSLELSNRKV
ncbi:unnamed protein product [Ranitomeya imitator]|uniref:Tc1-like transposase DDE domain-containing protein n=1 Tax=Ranitomeya imitator TaxID=111125 RepID=A0ABN9MG02_9NEOB|nr:unnamed protein product [Ranitomeya imitator]